MTSSRGALMPTYHLVSAETNAYVYSNSVPQLHEQFAFMRSENRVSVSPVSFDDGHASHYRYAYPILEEYGVPAIFFVIAGWINRRPDYMTWSNLQELVRSKYQVQSHGLTHRFLTLCTDGELKNEVQSSKVELEQRLGLRVDAISIPFGRWDRRVLSACAAAGYKRIYTSDPHPVKRHQRDLQVFGRFMVQRSTTVEEIRRALHPAHNALRWLAMKQDCKRLLRRAVGEAAYHNIWGWLRSRRALEEAGKEY